MGDKASLKASELCSLLRVDGYKTQTDICGRGLKAQMKYADKIGAKFSMVLGDDEVDSAKAKIKDMKTGAVTEINLNETVEDFGEIMRQKLFESIAEVM